MPTTQQIDKVYKWIERISLIALVIYTLLTGFHTYLGGVYALWAVVFILRIIKHKKTETEKRCLLIGIYTGAICFVILIILFFLRFGSNWLTNEDPVILYFFIPLWVFLFGYVGYGTSRFYYQQKEIYFPYNTRITEVQDKERVDLWHAHKRNMYARLMFLLFKLFGLACPILLLAYLDDSKYVRSNPYTIIALGLLSIICLITSKKLKSNKGKE